MSEICKKILHNLIYLLDYKSTSHLIHKFINLHITLTFPVQHDIITLIESLSYYVHLYIHTYIHIYIYIYIYIHIYIWFLIPKPFEIKQPILNHNTFNFNQTTIYSKQEILQQNLELVTLSLTFKSSNLGFY